MPEEYTNETVPEAIQDLWNQWWITITCEGEVCDLFLKSLFDNSVFDSRFCFVGVSVGGCNQKTKKFKGLK